MSSFTSKPVCIHLFSFTVVCLETVWSRLALDSQSSCDDLLNAGITGTCQCMWIPAFRSDNIPHCVISPSIPTLLIYRNALVGLRTQTNFLTKAASGGVCSGWQFEGAVHPGAEGHQAHQCLQPGSRVSNAGAQLIHFSVEGRSAWASVAHN